MRMIFWVSEFSRVFKPNQQGLPRVSVCSEPFQFPPLYPLIIRCLIRKDHKRIVNWQWLLMLRTLQQMIFHKVPLHLIYQIILLKLLYSFLQLYFRVIFLEDLFLRNNVGCVEGYELFIRGSSRRRAKVFDAGFFVEYLRIIVLFIIVLSIKIFIISRVIDPC